MALERLRGVSFFGRVPGSVLRGLLGRDGIISCGGGRIVFRSHDEAGAMCFICSNRIVLCGLAGRKGQGIVFVLKGKQLLGRDVMDGGPGTLFYRTTYPIRIVRVTRGRFLRLVRRDRTLAETILERCREGL